MSTKNAASTSKYKCESLDIYSLTHLNLCVKNLPTLPETPDILNQIINETLSETPDEALFEGSLPNSPQASPQPPDPELLLPSGHRVHRLHQENVKLLSQA